MGRIKIKAIKKAGLSLFEKVPESFDETFETNKKALRNTTSSKKVRNKIAGYITRLKRNRKNIIQ